MSGQRHRSAFLFAAASLVASAVAAPAAAATIDLGFLTGGDLGTDELVVTAADGNVVTFRAVGGGSNTTLKAANFVGSIFDGGICAADTSIGTWLSDCELPLEVTFAQPVDNLVFEQQGVQVLDYTSIIVETLAGEVANGTLGSLANINLLGILDGRQIDLSYYSGITRIQVDSAALLSTATYFGDFSFDTAPATSTVPAPPAILGLLTGVAAFGAVRRRRRARG